VPAGFTLNEAERTPTGWGATFTVPDGSILFHGHFPGRPVLPGIGFLSMVNQTLAAAAGVDKVPLHISGLRRIKFRRLVETGGAFDVCIGQERTAAGAHPIRVHQRGDIVMDGHVILSDALAPGPHVLPDTDLTPAPSQVALEGIIPHRRPMRLVDQLEAIRIGEAITRCVVQPSWPMVVDGSAPSVLLIEVVAQTAAACVGWEKIGEERGQGGDYLVGIRRAHLSSARVDAGQSILTRAVTIQRRSNFAVFDGMVTSDGEIMCTATIQAFRPSQEEAPRS
jgi:3-hydroxymyristoyl/3-hydroxydecanoyl-(acyl carrier protein) dehydratase